MSATAFLWLGVCAIAAVAGFYRGYAVGRSEGFRDGHEAGLSSGLVLGAMRVKLQEVLGDSP